jgi:pSer/pThr/pTyr-binding forkhead associated (FHA) protein
LIPNGVFIALRFVFLALLYVFIILLIRAIYRDMKAPAYEPAARPSRRKRKQVKPELVVVAADRNIGARYDLADHITIGRAPGSNIVIDDTYASQLHARVFKSEGGFYIEDLGSTNGTYVNGRKISYPRELREGDRIKIGRMVFEFSL